MARHAELPGALQGRPFRLAEGRALGVSRSTLRSRAIPAPFYGMRSVGHDPADLWSRCRAASVVLPPGAAFSHETALELLGLPLPRLPGAAEVAPLHVTVPAGTTPPRVRGVLGHVTNFPVQTLRINGLRVTEPLRAWCDLAAQWRCDDLVVLGDAIVSADAPRCFEPMPTSLIETDPLRLASLADRAEREARALATLRAAADEWVGRRGRLKLMAAADQVRAGVDSPPESRARLLVVSSGLPEPVVNLDIYDRNGIWLHRPDLSWPQWRTGLDYDGKHHFVEEKQVRRDQTRREDLRSIDWQLIVITNHDLYRRRDFTVRRLATALRRGGWRA